MSANKESSVVGENHTVNIRPRHAVWAYEKQLKTAMLQSNITALDNLLAPDLMFTNHLGGVMSKQDDLQAHRSGLIHIEKISYRDLQLRLLGDDVAIVAVRARIRGSFRGEASENDFRFTRVWHKATQYKSTPRAVSQSLWQLKAAHSCLLA